MRGVPTPARDEDFTADPAELFFDLAFVFAFSRLVSHLVHHPDWTGVADFALLLAMIWLPWSQFTWSANAVAGNSRPVRVLFLIGTIASIPMAGSVTTALDDGGPAFAISLAVILAIALSTMRLGLGDAPEVRSGMRPYALSVVVGGIMFVAGGLLEDASRTSMWCAGIAVFLLGTVAAGRSEWIIRPGHFAERHGLIMIVALGEVIVALGIPVVQQLEEGAGLAGHTALALVAAGVLACLLWWGYFDRPSPALEHRNESLVGGRERGRFARDVYTYCHFPLIAGVILIAAALEEITLHPQDPLGEPFRWMLVGGLALYLLGVVVAIARAFRALAVERLVAVVGVLGLVTAMRDVDGVVVLVAVDVVLAAVLLVEHLRVEAPFRRAVAS
jgi:low temperature requirement protein LtrA